MENINHNLSPNDFLTGDALNQELLKIKANFQLVAPSYKEYAAVLTQSGSNAPVATVLNSNADNYLGDIEWSRVNPGQYWGTLMGKLIHDKKFVFIHTNYHGNDSAVITATDGSSDDIIALNSYAYAVDGTSIEGTLTDGIIEHTFIEVRVYE